MRTLRWGLVGASDVAATRIIPAMRRLGHQIAGVSSISDEHAAGYAQRHEIPYFTSNIDVLVSRDDVDAVYVSTINRLHYPYTLSAAAAGKHVLCEKPVALNLPDAWAMVRACESAGVVFAVNHHLPCAATHREIRRILADGAVGRPLGVHHRSRRRRGQSSARPAGGRDRPRGATGAVGRGGRRCDHERSPVRG